MALSSTEKKPDGISLQDAYSAIRTWYQQHIETLLARRDLDVSYAHASAAIIRALPDASMLSEVEIVWLFGEVIGGRLEWAYHESDGIYKMAAYAKAALESKGRSYLLTAEETQQIELSSLWPLIKR